MSTRIRFTALILVLASALGVVGTIATSAVGATV